MFCEDAVVSPIEENLPDMDMGDVGEELNHEEQNPQSQSEKPQPQPDSGS